METKEKVTHTPGPWKIEGYSIQGEKGEYIASVSPDDGNCPALINARLIAACPKMYDFVELRAKEGDENAQKILRDMRP